MQLNATPYLGSVHGISLAHYYGKRPCHGQPSRVVNSRFHMYTGLTPRPITVIFGLGTRLHLRMHTTFENDVLRNRQQLQVCLELAIALVNSYEDTRDQEHFTLRCESFLC